jgi:hypothetical protein
MPGGSALAGRAPVVRVVVAGCFDVDGLGWRAQRAFVPADNPASRSLAMTTIRTTPPLTPTRSVAAADDRRPAAASTPEAAAIVDRFEQAAPRKEQLVASHPLGIAAAFVLNGVAIVGGVSNTMTGIGTTPALPRPTAPTTELVVRRGLGGA